jgi:ClpP class serine protease
MTAQRYERRGLLAIEPSALLDIFFAEATAPENEEIDNVTVVKVHGPLEHHDGDGWCDSYDAIRERAAAAFGGNARAVILHVDSPGGDVSGCFETAIALRTLAETTNKPLYAYVDGKATSAGYALACAANAGIAVSATSLLGSIGVLSTRPDYSAMNAARGLRVEIVASGSRKADGHPDQPISDAELRDTERLVNEMADVFFATVSTLRPQLTPDALRALDARLLTGQSAVSTGLADVVTTFEQTLAAASQGNTMQPTVSAKSDWEAARDALEKVAAGEDANAERAREALAAMDGGSEGDKSDDDTEKKKSDDSDADAASEGGDDSPADDDTKKKKDDAASSAQNELSALAEVHKLRAEIQAERENAKRDALLASRPDLSPRMVALLAKQPVETVRKMLAELPKLDAAPSNTPSNSKPKPAAAASVQGTRGATTTNSGGPQLSPEAKAKLDRAMGMTSTTFGVRNETYKLSLGVPVPANNAKQ